MRVTNESGKSRGVRPFLGRFGGFVRWMDAGMRTTERARIAGPRLTEPQAAALLMLGRDETVPKATPAEAMDPLIPSRARRATGGVTLAVLGAVGCSVGGFLESGRLASNALPGSGSVGPGAPSAHPEAADPCTAAQSEVPDVEKSKMKKQIQGPAAAAIGAALATAGTGSAQDVVQWRTESGGNGHWYELVTVPGGGRIAWGQAETEARLKGGTLACVSTETENRFIAQTFRARMIDPWSCWLGGYLTTNCSWAWVTSEPFDCEAMPDSGYPQWTCPRDCGENRLYTGSFGEGPYIGIDNHWDAFQGGKTQSLVEWSADCNGDGIVDYGQVRSGMFADADGDNVPDCCERGEPCVPEPATCEDADLFPDTQVNGADLGVMLSQWGTSSQFTVSDLNHDSVVDGLDLGILLSFWGPCSP